MSRSRRARRWARPSPDVNLPFNLPFNLPVRLPADLLVTMAIPTSPAVHPAMRLPRLRHPIRCLAVLASLAPLAPAGATAQATGVGTAASAAAPSSPADPIRRGEPLNEKAGPATHLPPVAARAAGSQVTVLTPEQMAQAIKGQVRGERPQIYSIRARKGQRMYLAFRPVSSSATLRLRPPGSDVVLFTGTYLLNDFEGTLEADGDYILQIELGRDAARRGEVSSFTLEVELDDDKAAPSAR